MTIQEAVRDLKETFYKEDQKTNAKLITELEKKVEDLTKILNNALIRIEWLENEIGRIQAR